MQKIRSADVHATQSAPQDRRTRHRLRDLCDEVLASYRAARGYQIFNDRDREEAYSLLEQVIPMPVRRQA